MRARFLNRLNLIIASLLAMLGFNNAHAQEIDVIEKYGGPMPEIKPIYGGPYVETVEYAVTGKVTDKRKKPVSGVEIIVAEKSGPVYNVLTDADGSFYIPMMGRRVPEQVIVEVRDPSEKYASETIIVELNEVVEPDEIPTAEVNIVLKKNKKKK